LFQVLFCSLLRLSSTGGGIQAFSFHMETRAGVRVPAPKNCTNLASTPSNFVKSLLNGWGTSHPSRCASSTGFSPKFVRCKEVAYRGSRGPIRCEKSQSKARYARFTYRSQSQLLPPGHTGGETAVSIFQAMMLKDFS